VSKRPLVLRDGIERIGLAIALAFAALLLLAASSSAAPGPSATRLLYAAGRIVPIPAAIPHEAGDMVDRRIVRDLRWIARRYPIFITDGYSGPLPNGEHVGCNGCHVRGSDHYNGLAVDIVPLNGSGRCDAAWAPITRLAHWAEPVQSQPRPPFRWVGYEGDAGHGCGNHLHLSWNHAPAPQFQLAEWVEVFPVGPAPPSTPAPATPAPAETGGEAPRKRRPGAARATAASPGPAGGVSRAPTGGLGTRGD
jgi:hypothetical protein